MAETDLSDTVRQDTVLKLLSGAQAGAEIYLGDGQYLIGTDDDADIVLQDRAIGAKHALLGIQGRRIHVEARDLPVRIGDRVISPQEDMDMSAPVVIGLETTQVAIGTTDTDWSLLELPHSIDTQDSSVEPQNGEEQTDEDIESTDSTDSETTTAEAAPLTDPEEQPQQSRGLRSPLRWGLAIVAVLLVAAVLMIFRHDLFTWKHKDSSAAKRPATLTELDKANNILKGPAFKEIHASQAKDGTIVLQGYCETDSCKNRAVSEFAKAGIPIDNRIWIEQWLKRAVRETLARFGETDLTFDYLGDGAIRLRGFLVASHRKEELLETLRNDVPGITRIDTAGLKKISQAAAMLREGVKQAGLEGKLTIKVNGARLLASGDLDSTQMARWQRTAQNFAKKTQGRPPVDSKVKLMGDEAPAKVLDKSGLTILGVMVTREDPPFAAAILGNGAILSEGDKIDGRYVIRKIDFDRVVLWNGEKESVYRVGGM